MGTLRITPTTIAAGPISAAEKSHNRVIWLIAPERPNSENNAIAS
jgi:hypothetical protein